MLRFTDHKCAVDIEDEDLELAESLRWMHWRVEIGLTTSR